MIVNTNMTEMEIEPKKHQGRNWKNTYRMKLKQQLYTRSLVGQQYCKTAKVRNRLCNESGLYGKKTILHKSKRKKKISPRLNSPVTKLMYKQLSCN